MTDTDMNNLALYLEKNYGFDQRPCNCKGDRYCGE